MGGLERTWLACCGGIVSGGWVFSTYIHDLNPVLWRISDAIQLRWYGLAYLMGFLCGFLLLQYMAKKKLWVLKPDQAGDFIAALALFGVFIGGRLGYILFYQIPDSGWGPLLDDPFLVFKVWKGGMASHGGIFGVAIFTWFYARKHKVTWTGLGDGVCVVAPIGLFFGRVANFINGELYGRVTNGVAWAVKFPLSLSEDPNRLKDAWRKCVEVDPDLGRYNMSPELLVAASRENEEILQILGEHVDPRHPSQLYEAFLEGALLFGILWWVRVKFPKAPDGLLAGLFFALYPILRIIGEQFREPDSAMVWVLTKGQFFSLFMFIFAAAFLVNAWKKSREMPKTAV